MTQPATITAAVLDQILTFLAPLFLAAADADLIQAREAARAMIDSYQPRTNRELRLAALAVAFSFGALDTMSRSCACDLTTKEVMRLRANANALNRSAAQNETRYEKLQKQAPEAEPAPPGDLPASTMPEDLLAFARTTMNTMAGDIAPTAPPSGIPSRLPMSRQQRRYAERKAEKKHRQEEELLRRAEALAAHRAGSGSQTAVRT